MVNGADSETMTAKRVDPFATFKFHVEIKGIEEAAFTECSGLEISTEVYEYQEGGLNEYVHKLPGRIKMSNVTLKRGFAISNAKTSELHNWYSEIEEALLTGNEIAHKEVTITLYSTAKQGEKMSWTLNKAFPVKWVGPAFKSDEAAVAIESLEFAHHGITQG